MVRVVILVMRTMSTLLLCTQATGLAGPDLAAQPTP